MTSDSQHNLINKLKPGKVILPVIIGLGFIVFLIIRETNSDILSLLTFTWNSIFWLFIAWLCMACRDLGYIIRIRVFTDNKLSWLQAFRIIMLWEFTSAVTPSTVGGTAVAVIFLNKEGIPVGKSTAVVLATSFLDELYFVLMLPVLILVAGRSALFSTAHQTAGINELIVATGIGYTLVLLWVIIVGYGLFFNPEGIRKLILAIFRLPIIRRWQASAEKAGDDIVESSRELKEKQPSFWIKTGTATALSWTARYWVVNAVLMAFFSVQHHLLIFARQLVTWLMMIISPTPGGSGFAELIMSRYISDLIPADQSHAGSLSIAMAIIWRLISYYPYLFIGAIILPGWIERKFIKPLSKKK